MSAETTADTVGELADTYAEAWSTRNIDRILASHHPDMRFEIHAPGFGPSVGHNQVRASLESIFQIWPDLQLEVANTYVGRDFFVYQYRISGGHVSHSSKAARSFSVDAIDIITCESNLVMSKDTYLDSLALRDQTA